ncbi:transporter [Candidatus Omnitrophota bacterium]
MNKNLAFILYILIFYTFVTHTTAYAVRPLSTEDATVIDKGSLEVEGGFEWTRLENRDDNYSFVLVPNYGLLEHVQICCEIPFDIIRPEDDSDQEGLGDIGVASKILILQETERIPSVVFKSIVKLSTGDEDKGLGSGDEDVTLILAATKSIGKVTLHSNIGYSFVGKEADDSLKDCMLYGVAFEYPVGSELSIVGEVYGESESGFNKDSHVISPLVGLRYQLTENITFDTAFKIGTSYEKKTDYGIIGGLSMSF